MIGELKDKNFTLFNTELCRKIRACHNKKRPALQLVFLSLFQF